jgi:hypothetical protein
MMGWSMKKDRELKRLVRSNLNVDRIATELKTSPLRIKRAGKRLGFHLPPIASKQNGRLKAKK